MKTSILEHSSLKAETGFIVRLDEVIRLAGISYGLQKVISEFSGLSLDGVKKMYQQDRPPRPKALNRLVSNIVNTLAEVKGIECEPDALRNYLILGQGHASDLVSGPLQSIKPEEEAKPQLDISGFVNADPVYTSQVILKIEEIAQQLNINTSKDVKESQMRLIQYRIISFCHKNRSDVNGKKVAKLIESLFDLATQDLL